MSEKRYWFGRKRWGWGWTPITWEGWASLVVLVAVVAVAGALLGGDSSTGSVLAFVVIVVVAVACLIALTVAKGPSARWQWGGSSTPEDDEPPR